MMNYLPYYFILINIIGLFVMKFDKSSSKRKNARRTPEKTLLAIALFGGSIGVTFGMYLFRHKTRKIQFKLGLPIIIIFQIVVILSVRNYL